MCGSAGPQRMPPNSTRRMQLKRPEATMPGDIYRGTRPASSRRLLPARRRSGLHLRSRAGLTAHRKDWRGLRDIPSEMRNLPLSSQPSSGYSVPMPEQRPQAVVRRRPTPPIVHLGQHNRHPGAPKRTAGNVYQNFTHMKHRISTNTMQRPEGQPDWWLRLTSAGNNRISIPMTPLFRPTVDPFIRTALHVV